MIRENLIFKRKGYFFKSKNKSYWNKMQSIGRNKTEQERCTRN